MTVVGHVDQMRQSACYQKSPGMSCLTCHNPHQQTLPKDQDASYNFYREKCLNCHNTQPCKLELAQRLKKEPKDNCLACHMPRSDTEVPHVSFTHHRIGIHPQPQQPVPQRIPELVATDDLSHLSNLDRERSLGLAYQIVRRKPEYASYMNDFRERERIHLEAAYAGGLRDAETLIGLAELYSRGNRPRACEYAKEGLAAKETSTKARVMALMVLAYTDFQNQNDPEAIAELEELVQKRRLAEDWGRLGTIYFRQKEPDKALFAFKKALEIRPFRSASHAGLADVYGLLGKPKLAEEHREKAEWLKKLKQD
jgi:tetratricopeptide (TPR) repeat protein